MGENSPRLCDDKYYIRENCKCLKCACRRRKMRAERRALELEFNIPRGSADERLSMTQEPVDALDQLSLKAFVEIENTFTWFYAAPETRKWTLKVNHCTYREFSFEMEGQNLADLSRDALIKLEAAEPELRAKYQADINAAS